MIFRFFNSPFETENRIVIHAYTTPKHFTQFEREYVRRLFWRCFFYLAVTVACVAGVMVLGDLLFSFIGIFCGVQAIRNIWEYFGVVKGDGIRTVIEFYNDRICVRSFQGVYIKRYDEVRFALLGEKGLTIRYEDGGGVGIAARDLEESEYRDEVLRVLRVKLGRRYKNEQDNESVRAKQNEEAALDRSERQSLLGTQLAESSYEVTGADRRDYCKLVLSTGIAKKVFWLLVPVCGGIGTAMLIAFLIAGENIYNDLGYIFIILTAMLLLISRIGISAPALARFPRTENGERLTIHIHQHGVACSYPDGKLRCKYSDMRAVRIDEKIGMACELKTGEALFVPVDTVTEELLLAVKSITEKK